MEFPAAVFCRLVFQAHRDAGSKKTEAGAVAVDCGSSTNRTSHVLNNATDAAALGSQCPTIWGNVLLGPNTSGTIDLDGVENITGSIGVTRDYGSLLNTHLTSIESSSLLQIGGSVDVHNASMVQSISLPKLEGLPYTFSLALLPALRRIDLSSLQNCGTFFGIHGAPVLDNLIIPASVQAGSKYGVNIAYTNLKSINGFTSSSGGVYIAENPQLSRVNLQMTETVMKVAANGTYIDGSGSLTIQGNSPAVNISLPNLASTNGSINLGNCSKLSMPSLSVVNGSLFIYNASFSYLSLPNLSIINGTLNITGSFSGYASRMSLSQPD
jgi:hypothetical protein